MIYKLLIDNKSGAPYIDTIEDTCFVQESKLCLEHDDLTFEEEKVVAFEYKKAVEYLCNGYLKRCLDEIKESMYTLVSIIKQVRIDGKFYKQEGIVTSDDLFYEHMEMDIKFTNALDIIRTYCDCYDEEGITWYKLVDKIVRVFGNDAHPASIWIEACRKNHVLESDERFIKLPELLQCVTVDDIYIKEGEEK